jgi:hypothetical protein
MQFFILVLGIARYMLNTATPYQLKSVEWISIGNFESNGSMYMYINT